MKIAIDGPAASGKSTMAVALAERLGFLFFDTGVMYRAVTLACIEQGIPLDEEQHVTVLAKRVQIEVLPPTQQDGRQSTVLLDGRDVTWEIRQKQVDASVSIPSKYAGVRHEMVLQQRRVAEQGNIIMAGRDIGTVVLPNAELKIYLTASVEERAQRRLDELKERGTVANYEEVLASMRERDRIDSTRTESPLKPADDAITIDSTGMSKAEALDALSAVVASRKREIEARAQAVTGRLVGPAKALRTLRKNAIIMDAVLGTITHAQAAARRDGPTGWSILLILCHLRDYERIVHERIRLMLETNHPRFPVWNQEAAPLKNNYASQHFPDVLAEWHGLRDQTLLWLESQLPEAWARTGLSIQGECNLVELATNTGLHDIDHVEQITRCG